MTEVVLAVCLWFALLWLSMIVLILLGRRSLRRANRVTPGQSSPAPVSWLWSPTSPARLHRRLRALAAPIDPCTPGLLPAAPLTDDLRRGVVDHAVRVDVELVRSRRSSGPTRRRQIRSLRDEVSTLEQLTACLADGAPPPLRVPPPLGEVAERVDHLHRARLDVDQLTTR